MHAEVGLVHWRYRMSAHRRMPIESKRLTVQAGPREEIAKHAVPTEPGGANHQRRYAILKHSGADVDSSPDAPNGRGRIKRRADFIVHKLRAMRRECSKRRRQFLL